MISNFPSDTTNGLIVSTPPGSDAEWDWILGVMLGDWLGLTFHRKVDSETRHVTLSSDADSKVHAPVVLGADFWLQQEDRCEGYCDPVEPLVPWTAKLPEQQQALTEPQIPILFGAMPGADIPIDIFGSAFWMLARIEELSTEGLDNHGRFPGARSLAARAGFVDRPIIDEYVALLREALSQRFPSLLLRSSKFRMHISHDVDAPSRLGLGMSLPWLKGVVRQVCKERSPKGLATASRRLIKTPRAIESNDPMNTFDYLMAQSEKRGIRSAFYFFGGRTNSRSDAAYNLAHPAIQALLTDIHSRGHEIGLHPSYNTYLDPDAIAAEAQSLFYNCRRLGIQQDQWGGRMHFLRWRWPDTATAWSDAGLHYDSTLGFADRAGFRCGTSQEYTAFDPIQREAIPLRLRPLIVMECTIVAPRYMGLNYSEAAYETMFKLKDTCRKYGGGFSLLWHNSHFTTPEDRALYEAVLDR